MDRFEQWRREVNIILNDALGLSLADLNDHIEDQVKVMHDDGYDPMDAAQYVAGELDPTIDVEEILADRMMPKIKMRPQPKKNTRKFRDNDE